MSRLSAAVLAPCLVAALFVPAEAAKRRIQVPDRFDGSWSITAVTEDGPCPASTSYQVQIKDSDASVPGDEIDVDGGVSQSGAVQATIIKGANRVPIAGTLDAKGSGTGTVHHRRHRRLQRKLERQARGLGGSHGPEGQRAGFTGTKAPLRTSA